MSRYPSDFLKMVRNQILIQKVITTMLNMELHGACKRLQFRCRRCYNFHTATNPTTNLARCFDCKENFNPIDLIMAVSNLSLTEAVEYLKEKWGNLRCG